MTKEEQKRTDGVEKKKPTLKKSIICALISLFILWYCYWTGYWICLLFIPIVVDIYVTRFVPWGCWRNAKNPTVRTIVDWVDAILFALIGVWFINTTFIQNYQIPTSSLEKSLLVGDFLCVSKLSYGGRSPMTLFSLPLMQHTIPGTNIKSYLNKPQLDYKRFKGGDEIKRYDIVVFNYPSGDTVATNMQNRDYYSLRNTYGRDYMIDNPDQFGEIVYRPIDRRENYVKRCVGLPGDSLEMIDDVVYINNEALPSPENMQLLYCIQTDGTQISDAVFEDLNISEDDKYYKDNVVDYRTYADTASLHKAGLKSFGENGGGLLYTYVFLTQEMIAKLEKRSFVKTIMRQNEYLKNIGHKKTKEDIYPLAYYYNRETDYGSFPKIWVPKRGATISFDTDVEYKVAAYERCIKNYEHNDFAFSNGEVFINGEKADSYTFKYDYFFMMGDNRDNSADSRAWGFVPEDHIVGKPLFIFLSLDKDKGWFDGKIRWNRIFTSGNKNK